MHRRVKTISIVDGQILGEIEELRDTIRSAKQAETYNTRGLADESPRLEQQLVELAQKAVLEALVLKVQALPGDEFDGIVRKHPPSPDQFDHYQQQLKAAPWLATVLEPPQLNPDTMGPDLLTACLIEPDWSPNEVEQFWQELSKGEQNYLWNEIHKVQVQGADLPFFNAATAATNGGGELLTSHVNGGSPSQNF